MGRKKSSIFLHLVVLLNVIPVRNTANTTLHGAFHDINLQNEIYLASKDLNIVANSSIVRRDLGLNQFINEMADIGKLMAARKSDRSFLFTDFVLNRNEITREIVQAEFSKVDNGSTFLVVDNELSGEHRDREDPLYGVSEAPFALLRFCTKTERKTSVFVKVFTLICTKTPQKRRFPKTLSKVDIHKNGDF